MPIPRYVQEAEELQHAADTYLKPIAPQGLNPELYEQLRQLTEELQEKEEELRLRTLKLSKEEEEWKELSPKAFEFRDWLLKTVKFVYRNDRDGKKILMRLRKKKDVKTMVSDLQALSGIPKHFDDRYKNYGIEDSDFKKAWDIGNRTNVLFSDATIARKNITLFTDNRNNAYLALAPIVKEVRAWGQQIYPPGTEEYIHFTSEFYRERNAKAKERQSTTDTQ